MMNRLNDTTYRQELIKRYLNAETTLEEEEELRGFYRYSDPSTTLSREEEDLRTLLDLDYGDPSEYEISEAKAEEFDRIMAKQKAVRLRKTIWRISSAAAAILVASGIVFLTKYRATKESPYAESTAPDLVITDFGDCSNLAEIIDNLQVCEPMGQPESLGETVMSEAIMPDALEAILQKDEIETYDIKAAGDAALITLAYKNGSYNSYIAYHTEEEEALNLLPVRNTSKEIIL